MQETKKAHNSEPFLCDPERIRTPNPQSRNLIFYPVELLGHKEQK